MKLFSQTLAISISLMMGSAALAGEFRGVLKNNEGVKNFQKKPVEAFDRFSDALVDLPYSGEVHYNLGTTFLQNREFEKALSEYQQAIKHAPSNSARDQEVRFRSLFNSAVVLTELKKTDEALNLYQKALELNPDSVETKTNIELLTQQGGGEGEGESDQKNDKGEQKDDKSKGQGQDEKKQDQPQKIENPKPKPRPFKSEELGQQDVKRILEELKRQEEQIRARMQNEQSKDAPPAKDW
jgi:tetratricopeptide (TPR) repeat protein